MSTPEQRKRSGRFRLAHLSDPHLTSLDDVHWPQLLNKRLLGWLSWNLKRRYIHRPALLRLLLADLLQNRPAHIAVTGDLTQLGTVPECRQALAWLEQLGPPDRVSLIPGNHDRYAPADWSAGVGRWSAYMRGDGDSRGEQSESLFPALRMRGPLALIGLSTAQPTAPFLASGRLGRRQLQELERLLAETGRAGYFRVVMLHHGPVPGTYSRRRGLRDGGRFCEVLQRRGAELVLHGHGHRHIQQSIGGDSPIPVIGAASASYDSREPERRAAYNIYDIAASDGGWHLALRTRVYDFDRQAFVDGPQRDFALPAPTAA